MNAGSVPPPIPPEEREPARFWPAEFDPAPQPPADYYRPEVDEPHGGLATWGIRVLGALLDGLVVAVPVAIAQIAAVVSGDEITGVAAVVAFVSGLAALALALWNVVWRQGKTGQTLGKSWVGIRLIDEGTGAPLGPGMTVVRQLAHILDALPCYLGFLWPLWDRKRQTFADKLMGSVVIRT